MRALVREAIPNFGVPRLLSPPGKSEVRLTWVRQVIRQRWRAEGSLQLKRSRHLATFRGESRIFAWRPHCLSAPHRLPPTSPPLTHTAGLTSVGGGELGTVVNGKGGEQSQAPAILCLRPLQTDARGG